MERSRTTVEARKSGRSMAGLSMLLATVALVGGSPAIAQGPLQPGEILVAASSQGQGCRDGFVARVDPNPPHNATVISNFGSRAVVVGGRDTIYTLDVTGTYPGVARVYKINVNTGAETLIYDFGSLTFGDIALEPTGTLVALVDTTVFRLDPTAGPAQTPEAIVTDASLWGLTGVGSCGWGSAIEVDANGDIFVSSYGGVYEIAPGTATPVWGEGQAGPGRGLAVDRATEELIFHQWDTTYRVDLGPPMTETEVFSGLDLYSTLLATIALDPSGDVIFATGGPSIVNRGDIETNTLIPITSPEMTGMTWNSIAVVFPLCLNGVDDDGDGLVDLDDPFCAGDPTQDAETTACDDGMDNDGDGFADVHGVAGAALNGSFEVGSNPDPYFVTLTPGQTNMAEWSVDGEVDWVKNTLWQPSHGNRSIDLSGNFPGSVYRTIQTRAGVHYTVTFDLAGNPAGTDPIKVVRASAAGTSQDYNFDTTGKSFPDMGWETHQFEFTATTTETELRFEAISPQSAHGPVVDNIRIGDPDCRNADDNTEDTRACSDGLDNNNNGLIDYPNEPGCDDYDDKTECGSGAAQALVLLPFLWGRRKRRIKNGNGSTAGESSGV